MGTVVGIWRLRAIIMLSVLLTSVYVINGFFYVIDVDEAGYIRPTENVLDTNETLLETEGVDEGGGFIDFILGIGDYLTFGNIQNGYAPILINMFTSVCWIGIGYIIYTFIKEWVPLT